MNPIVKGKIVWAGAGAILTLLVALLLGGVYTITPLSGPVDAAYKITASPAKFG